MSSNYRNKFWIMVGGLTIFRLLYIYFEIVDLVGDETLYWEYSRRLDINYYAKGPVVAYIIRFFTSLGGNTPFYVRLGTVVISVLFAYLVYRFALELFHSHQIAFYTVVTFEFIPLFFAGGILMTIDSPFILFWLGSLYFIYKGLVSAEAKYWVLFGLCAGMGFLSKYTMFLIYPALWLYLFRNKAKAREVGSKNILLAHGVSFPFLLPLFIWNAAHDWATFRHVFVHMAGKSHFSFSLLTLWDILRHFLDLLGSQMGVVSPLFFMGILTVYFICFQAGKERDFEFDFLFWFSVPVLGVFVIRSFFGQVMANWPAPAYVASVFALVGAYFGRLPVRKESFPVRFFFMKKWVRTAFGIAGLSLLIISYPQLIEPLVLPFVKPGRGPMVRLLGWKELGGYVEKIVQEDSGNYSFVFSKHYQTTSELAFYANTGLPTLCASAYLGGRHSQYDYWPGFENFLGKNGIFVSNKDKIKRRLKQAFEKIVPLTPLKLKRRGYPFKTFYFFKCLNYLGFEKIDNDNMAF